MVLKNKVAKHVLRWHNYSLLNLKFLKSTLKFKISAKTLPELF